MKFQPIDEMSLRHLFSSELGEKALNLSYLGPTLNDAGQIDQSPDCLILDKKTNQVKRCEFKFDPTSASDFKHNGNFDIAIVWKLSKVSREKLLEGLKEQNGCERIINMSENAHFNTLLVYNHEMLNSIRFAEQSNIRQIALNSKYISVLFSYIAASNPNSEFHGPSLQNLFKAEFAHDLKELSINKISNLIVSHTQTKPQLIVKNRKDFYQWNHELDPKLASSVLGELLINNFKKQLPTKDFIYKILE